MLSKSGPGSTEPAIRIRENGPYIVRDDVPLSRTRAVVGDAGRPVGWAAKEPVEPRLKGDNYALCRCGHSADKPFCDATHRKVGFDGSPTLPEGGYDDRARIIGGFDIEVRDDRGICEHAEQCMTATSNIWKLVHWTDDPEVRRQVTGMVSRCPSGALTLWVDGDQVESDLPAGITIIDDGPLWVTGGVEIRLPDGTTMPVRNRVTLCRCGQSSIKPLCDGSHDTIDFRG